MTEEKTSILEAVHETAKGMHEAGVIDTVTMKEFDALCLSPVREYSGADLKALRERLNVSQPVLAAYLNVTKPTVAQWEQGVKKPRGPALKLLNVLDRYGLQALS